MSELVIVYSHQDETFVRDLVKRLQSRLPRTEVFYDALKADRASWTAALAAKIRSARVLLVVSSEHLATSMAIQELAFFHELPKRARAQLVVAKLDSATAAGQLNDAIRIDFSESIDRALDHLVGILQIRPRTFAFGVVTGALVGTIAAGLWLDHWLSGGFVGAALGGSLLGSFGEATAPPEWLDRPHRHALMTGASFGGFAGLGAALAYWPWGWAALATLLLTPLGAAALSWVGFVVGRWSRSTDGIEYPERCGVAASEARQDLGPFVAQDVGPTDVGLPGLAELASLPRDFHSPVRDTALEGETQHHEVVRVFRLDTRHENGAILAFFQFSARPPAPRDWLSLLPLGREEPELDSCMTWQPAAVPESSQCVEFVARVGSSRSTLRCTQAASVKHDVLVVARLEWRGFSERKPPERKPGMRERTEELLLYGLDLLQPSDHLLSPAGPRSRAERQRSC